MELGELEVYRLARALSKKIWVIYSEMDWHQKKIIGDQWIRSADSVGANIAEGFGRYHYLDKNRFNFNARGSLMEVRHWTELLYERTALNKAYCEEIIQIIQLLGVKLNNYISSTQQRAESSKK